MSVVAAGDLPRMEGRRDTLEDATLIVEVLSPSTLDYDLGRISRGVEGLAPQAARGRLTAAGLMSGATGC